MIRLRLLSLLPFLLLLMEAVAVACAQERSEGAPCGRDTPCEDDLECIAVRVEEIDEGICLPPVEHEPVACSSVEECVDAAFPVQAECILSECICPEETLACPNENEVPDPRRCACRFSTGGEGEFCERLDTCEVGLNCVDELCTPGRRLGDRCSEDHPCADSGLSCERTVFPNVCRGVEGAPCSEDGDCVSNLFCSGASEEGAGVCAVP